MAKTKELFGLIVGFTAGTFLGAMFMTFGRNRNQKKEKEKEKVKEYEDVLV